MADEPRIAPMYYLAVILSLLGFLRQAMALMKQARELEAKATNALARGMCSFVGAWPLTVCRDTEQVRRNIGVLEAIARDHRLSFFQAAATTLRAWLALEQGQPDEAVSLYQQGLDAFAAAGMRLGIPNHKAVQARALAACGYVEQAQGLIEEAIVEAERSAERWCEPDLWRLKAEILLCGRHRDVDQAQRTFEQALQRARAQGSVLFELRAATGLARLWAGQGRHAQAAQLLAPALDAIPEPMELPDIIEARTLLAELDGRCRTGVELGRSGRADAGQQEVRQRRDEDQRAQHVPDEHEGEQDAHVGLELDRRPGPGDHADGQRHADQRHHLAGEAQRVAVGFPERRARRAAARAGCSACRARSPHRCPRRAR